ncbi:hypothetical protein [Cellulomonas marina]|uniref:Tetratricopeptide repeat-containing protein n=1 Tax=Cellulomonas marina TaxID=988821 RepID=A0A1I0VX16_9CELL|nr:hypothetical protein [Cellulomonas marina]GIG27487.1 hypothetical protein Cma02nite_00870 [Cellulomonas marina]SFA80979.1 hypothetical protein SAMN05421867_10226 [Cellulomonas marina]
MALLPRLRQLMRRPVSASRVGARRPTGAARRGDTLHEDALRSMLGDDPNDEKAFVALAEIVRRRAAEAVAHEDPLSGHAEEAVTADRDAERQKAADLAVWSLGEELAGNPRAWYPLVEVARLSVRDDPEGAARRLSTAVERDHSGRALVAAVGLLRQAGRPVEALNLGVGHWRPKEHDPEVARELVLAALEADRPGEAKQHIAALDLHPRQRAVADLRTELQALVARAEGSPAGGSPAGA